MTVLDNNMKPTSLRVDSSGRLLVAASGGGGGGALPAGVTSPGDGALAFDAGTLTATRPGIDILQNWNNAAIPFTGMKFNVTDTASNAASLLADWQVGGTSRAAFRKDGALVSGVGIGRALYSLGASNSGFVLSNAGIQGLTVERFDGSQVAVMQTSGATFPAQIGLGSIGAGADVFLVRDSAANIFAQRNSTAAQTFRLYNTYTDASNYERGFMRWASNVLEIGTEAAGTGVARDVRFVIGNGTLAIATGSVAIDASRQFRIGTQVYMSSSAAGILRVSTDNITVGACALEQIGFSLGSEPSAPSATYSRTFSRGSSGATQLCTRFATGGIKILARESRFEAISAARTLVASDSGLVFNTASTTRAFTVNSGYGDGFEGVTVDGPCTWVAGGGVTLTDNRTAGAGYNHCQLVQIAADTYRVTGVTL